MADRATIRKPKITRLKKGKTMQVGKKNYGVSMTVINSGDQDWTTRTHRLVAVSPRQTKKWGKFQVRLPRDIKAGASAAIRFKVKAPKRARKGVPFQWQIKGPRNYLPRPSVLRKITVEAKK